VQALSFHFRQAVATSKFLWISFSFDFFIVDLQALAFNFGQAAAARAQGFEAETLLRFDDTNPEVRCQSPSNSLIS